MKNNLFKMLLLSSISLICVSCGNNGNTSSPLNNSESFSDIVFNEEVTLKFWHGFTGTDGDHMQTMVEDFNNQYKGQIKVEINRLDWDTLFTKFYQQKNNPKFSPNVVAIPTNRLGSVLSKNMLTEIDDIMEVFNLNKEEFLPAAYDIGSINGHRYSFPLDEHPTAIFYNKELTNKELTGYATWDDFYTDCLEFTKDGNYGWAMPNMYSITKDVYYSQLLQNNEDILDSNNNVNFNCTSGITILEKLKDLKYGTNSISPSTVSAGGDLTLFKAGKSAFYFDGPWMIETLKQTCDFAEDGNLGVIPMPQATGENGVSFAGSHQLCLAKNTTTTPQIKKAGYLFINYISENSLEWGKAGQVPARISIHESEEYKNIQYLDAFTQTAYKAKIGTTYNYFYEAYNFMGSAVAAALNNDASAKDALNEKANNYKRWLAEQ